MHRLPRKIENCNVLFVALNWGSGHVFRSIPILQELQSNGCQLTILETEDQGLIYRHYLKAYHAISWRGYRFRFSGKGNFTLDLAKVAVNLRSDYRQIRKRIQVISEERKIDLVLSDHVYGANSIDVESIFLTHQIRLPLPSWNPFHVLHRQFMREFSKVWIVDDEVHNLAGKLSQASEEHRTYIGWPSRFQETKENAGTYKTILLSGPEPYRSQFLDEILVNLPKDESYQVIGLEGDTERLRGVSSLDFKRIDEVLANSSEIWTRGGYTTLLDNQYIKARLHVFPTPGQAEQIYLNNKA